MNSLTNREQVLSKRIRRIFLLFSVDLVSFALVFLVLFLVLSLVTPNQSLPENKIERKLFDSCVQLHCFLSLYIWTCQTYYYVLKKNYLSFSSNSEVNAPGLLEDSEKNVSSLLIVDMHHGQMAVEFAFEISRLQSVNTTQIYC